MNKCLAGFLAAALLSAFPACTGDDPLDGEGDSFADGKADVLPGTPEAAAVLAVVNDRTVDFEELDDEARLNATAARNIIDHRDGPDGQPATDDDNLFDGEPDHNGDGLAELDAVPFVGPIALEALLAYAIETGRFGSDGDAQSIMSPQPADKAHTAKIAELIDGAQRSVDVAIYSFSNAKISDALERAADRGVEIRMIFETANDDKKLEGDALRNSKSGRLERAGINVRFVNKIMHHKFAIIDGPRDDLAAADTGTLASGSANWSNNGGTVFDENTVFLFGNAEANLRYQQEFNLMWEHSRDLVVDEPKPFELSGLEITEDMIPDDPDFDMLHTSDNFNVSATGTTFSTDKTSLAVADRWVEAIENADESIRIASGHLRMRPIAEALERKKADNPNMDIRVYLDNQEFVSFSGHQTQLRKREECLEDAVTDSEIFDCNNKSFLYSKEVTDAGVDLRFKYYAFRWHFSYAPQMHHKYMIVDGDELFTGSYNLSINAEHGTFENVMVFKGAKYANLINQYIANFESVWVTGHAENRLETLEDQVRNDQVFPIVFPSVALTWSEVSALKGLIIDNCPAIFSAEFRQNAPAHKVCDRDE